MPHKDSSGPITQQRFSIVKFPRGVHMPAREFGFGKILTDQALPVVVLDGEVLLETVEPATGRES